MRFMQKLLDVFKLESTRMSERTFDMAENLSGMSESKALSEIERANKLANTANKTTDREEFYNAIGEIESILTELSKYEHKFSFVKQINMNWGGSDGKDCNCEGCRTIKCFK